MLGHVLTQRVLWMAVGKLLPHWPSLARVEAWEGRGKAGGRRNSWGRGANLPCCKAVN